MPVTRRKIRRADKEVSGPLPGRSAGLRVLDTHQGNLGREDTRIRKGKGPVNPQTITAQKMVSESQSFTERKMRSSRKGFLSPKSSVRRRKKGVSVAKSSYYRRQKRETS